MRMRRISERYVTNVQVRARMRADPQRIAIIFLINLVPAIAVELLRKLNHGRESKRFLLIIDNLSESDN